MKVWSWLNRYRGNGHKTLALVGMFLIMLVLTLPAIYFRPELFWMSNYVQMGIVAFGELLALLVMYRFFWGSAAWHHLKDTSNEKLPPYAKQYAQRETGIIYDSNTSETQTLIYKDAAFHFVCNFRYFLGFFILACVTFNPAVMYLGRRGNIVAKTYIEEFKVAEAGAIERAEHKVGSGDGKAILKFAGFNILATVVIYLLYRMANSG